LNETHVAYILGPAIEHLKVILDHIRLRVFNFMTNENVATQNTLCRKIWFVHRT